MTNDDPSRSPTDAFERAAVRSPLRFGGEIALVEDAILIDRDDEKVQVNYDNVTQVTVRDYDYFLGVLSVTLVGFGIWFARDNPLALLFSVAGVLSAYQVYRKRNEIVVHVKNRPKPIRLHPENFTPVIKHLEPAIAPEEKQSQLS